MAHDYSSKNDYLLQVPYLNDSGSPRVVTIRWHDARELVSDGTHQLLNAGSEIYLVTPIKPPVVGHIYQIGCEAI